MEEKISRKAKPMVLWQFQNKRRTLCLCSQMLK